MVLAGHHPQHLWRLRPGHAVGAGGPLRIAAIRRPRLSSEGGAIHHKDTKNTKEDTKKPGMVPSRPCQPDAWFNAHIIPLRLLCVFLCVLCVFVVNGRFIPPWASGRR